MTITVQQKRWRGWFRSTAAVVVTAFAFLAISPPNTQAQFAGTLPPPGVPVPLSEGYAPAMMHGLRVYPENPLQFDFLIGPGNTGLEGPALKGESLKLIRYFLAALTVPEADMWVNLSPHERDRISPPAFGITEMGRDLLGQDYLLKQVTASLLSPEKGVGQSFWQRVYDRAYAAYGTTQVPVDTFNKVWIVPERAEVFVNADHVFVIDSHLKVMLEQDYVALSQPAGRDAARAASREGESQDVSTAVIRELIVPEIERDVNTGKNFASLRQVFHAMILATWYKRNLRKSLLGRVYVGQRKVNGIEIDERDVKEKIYQRYLTALRQGVYNTIREEFDPRTQSVVPRKYFSGGIELSLVPPDPGRFGEHAVAAYRELSPTALADSPLHGQKVFRLLQHLRSGLVAVQTMIVSNAGAAHWRRWLPAVSGVEHRSRSRLSAWYRSLTAPRWQALGLLLVGGLTLAGFGYAPETGAATFSPGAQGTLQATVEPGDTPGHIVEQLRVTAKRADPQSYAASRLSAPLWGPGGAMEFAQGQVLGLSHPLYPGTTVEIPVSTPDAGAASTPGLVTPAVYTAATGQPFAIQETSAGPVNLPAVAPDAEPVAAAAPPADELSTAQSTVSPGAGEKIMAEGTLPLSTTEKPTGPVEESATGVTPTVTAIEAEAGLAETDPRRPLAASEHSPERRAAAAPSWWAWLGGSSVVLMGAFWLWAVIRQGVGPTAVVTGASRARGRRSGDQAAGEVQADTAGAPSAATTAADPGADTAAASTETAEDPDPFNLDDYFAPENSKRPAPKKTQPVQQPPGREESVLDGVFTRDGSLGEVDRRDGFGVTTPDQAEDETTEFRTALATPPAAQRMDQAGNRMTWVAAITTGLAAGIGAVLSGEVDAAHWALWGTSALALFWGRFQARVWYALQVVAHEWGHLLLASGAAVFSGEFEKLHGIWTPANLRGHVPLRDWAAFVRRQLDALPGKAAIRVPTSGAADRFVRQGGFWVSLGVLLGGLAAAVWEPLLLPFAGAFGAAGMEVLAGSWREDLRAPAAEGCHNCGNIGFWSKAVHYIMHVRYPTSGVNSRRNAHPFGATETVEHRAVWQWNPGQGWQLRPNLPVFVNLSHNGDNDALNLIDRLRDKWIRSITVWNTQLETDAARRFVMRVLRLRDPYSAAEHLPLFPRILNWLRGRRSALFSRRDARLWKTIRMPKGDTPVAALTMHLLLTVGNFPAAVRYAYTFGMNESAGEAMARPLSDPDQVALGQEFDAIFAEWVDPLYRTLPDHVGQRLADFWVTAEAADANPELGPAYATVQQMRREMQEHILTLYRKGEETPAGSILQGWQGESEPETAFEARLEDFVDATLERFFLGDRGYVMREFAQRAEGTFGLALGESINRDGVSIYSSGQPMVIGLGMYDDPATGTRQRFFSWASEPSVLRGTASGVKGLQGALETLSVRGMLAAGGATAVNGESMSVKMEAHKRSKFIQRFSRRFLRMLVRKLRRQGVDIDTSSEVWRPPSILVPLDYTQGEVADLRLAPDGTAINLDIYSDYAGRPLTREEIAERQELLSPDSPYFVKQPDYREGENRVDGELRMLPRYIRRLLKSYGEGGRNATTIGNLAERMIARDVERRIKEQSPAYRTLPAQLAQSVREWSARCANGTACGSGQPLATEQKTVTRRLRQLVMNESELPRRLQLAVEHVIWQLADTAAADLRRGRMSIDELDQAVSEAEQPLAAAVARHSKDAVARLEQVLTDAEGTEAATVDEFIDRVEAGLTAAFGARRDAAQEYPRPMITLTGFHNALGMARNLREMLVAMFPGLESEILVVDSNDFITDPWRYVSPRTIFIPVDTGWANYPTVNTLFPKLLAVLGEQNIFPISSRVDTAVRIPMKQGVYKAAAFKGQIFELGQLFFSEAQVGNDVLMHLNNVLLSKHLGQLVRGLLPGERPWGFQVTDTDLETLDIWERTVAARYGKLSGYGLKDPTSETHFADDIKKVARHLANQSREYYLGYAVYALYLAGALYKGWSVGNGLQALLGLPPGLATFADLSFYVLAALWVSNIGIVRLFTKRMRFARQGPPMLAIGSAVDALHNLHEQFATRLQALGFRGSQSKIKSGNSTKSFIPELAHEVGRGDVALAFHPFDPQKRGAAVMEMAQLKTAASSMFGSFLSRLFKGRPYIITFGYQSEEDVNPNGSDRHVQLPPPPYQENAGPFMRAFGELSVVFMDQLVAGKVLFNEQYKQVSRWPVLGTLSDRLQKSEQAWLQRIGRRLASFAEVWDRSRTYLSLLYYTTATGLQANKRKMDEIPAAYLESGTAASVDSASVAPADRRSPGPRQSAAAGRSSSALPLGTGARPVLAESDLQEAREWWAQARLKVFQDQEAARALVAQFLDVFYQIPQPQRTAWLERVFPDPAGPLNTLDWLEVAGHLSPEARDLRPYLQQLNPAQPPDTQTVLETFVTRRDAADSSTIMSDPAGGIDMGTSLLRYRERGPGMTWTVPADGVPALPDIAVPLDQMAPETYTPVILHMVPVANVYLLLGLQPLDLERAGDLAGLSPPPEPPVRRSRLTRPRPALRQALAAGS